MIDDKPAAVWEEQATEVTSRVVRDSQAGG